MAKRRITKAVFPVGGLGTRFLPVTKSIPKEMLPVAGKPLVQYVFEEAKAAGIEQFIFIIGRNKNVLNNHFDHSYELQSFLSEKEKEAELDLVTRWLPSAGSIAFIRQQEPLGLGHAVWCARHFIDPDEHFAVLLADEMLQQPGGFLASMVACHEATGANVVAVHEVPRERVSSYGIVEVQPGSSGPHWPLRGMVEKPRPEEAPSCLSITGRYVLHGTIFDLLARTERGSGGEIQLTDAMQVLLQTEAFYGLEAHCPRFDCGLPLGFLEANIAYSLHGALPEQSQRICAMLRSYAGSV
jgi:UTP-glucose-1-phosphate uridylyltransferase